MRAGEIIVGSLLWKQSPERDRWRQARLLVDQRLGVQAPIYYGRLSQSGTYTMTFGGQNDTGRAVCTVPCGGRQFGGPRCRDAGALGRRVLKG